MQSNPSRRLAAESLENRQLLAGDVSARVEGGILFLRGDGEGNGVLIRQTAGGLEVVGTAAGGGATTINGGASFAAPNVPRGMNAALLNGDDVLRFANADGSAVAIPGAVVAETGSGDDEISGRLRNSGAVTFTTGDGHDTVNLQGSQLGTLVINTDPALAANGAGNDRVTLGSVRAARAAVVRTGAGNDTVNIGGNSAFPLSLTVTTDKGNDRVNIEGTAQTPIIVGGALTVNAGQGTDRVHLERVSVRGPATVTQLAGEANVSLNYVRAVDGIFAYLGAGDDALSVTHSSARRAVLAGGMGNNSLVVGNNAIDNVITVGF